MKLIFLDIDGVLNSGKFYRERNNYGALPDYPLTEFCPKAVNNFNRITEKTDAKIVVSSTWRIGRTLKELQELLEKVGIKGSVIGKTSRLHDRQKYGDTVRGDEIADFLSKPYILPQHTSSGIPIKHPYVILDDDNDMLDWQLKNFVKTDSWLGLTKEDSEIAIAILNS